MIIKQLKGSGFGKIIEYLEKKVTNKKGKSLATNMAGKTISALKNEFNLIRSLRPYVSKAVYHASISVGKDEVISDETFTRIGEEFRELMGFSDCQYCLYRHYDRDHPHIHLLASRITKTGGIVSDRWDFRRGEEVARKLEKKYNLKEVLCSTKVEQKALSKGQIEKYRRTGEVPVQLKLQLIINETLKNTKSVKAFEQQLKEKSGVIIKYHRKDKGQIYGISYQLNNITLSGTKLGRKFTYPAIKRSFTSSNHSITPKNDAIKRIESTIKLELTKCNNLIELKKKLSNQGINIILHKTPENKLRSISIQIEKNIIPISEIIHDLTLESIINQLKSNEQSYHPRTESTTISTSTLEELTRVLSKDYPLRKRIHDKSFDYVDEIEIVYELKKNIAQQFILTDNILDNYTYQSTEQKTSIPVLAEPITKIMSSISKQLGVDRSQINVITKQEKLIASCRITPLQLSRLAHSKKHEALDAPINIIKEALQGVEILEGSRVSKLQVIGLIGIKKENQKTVKTISGEHSSETFSERNDKNELEQLSENIACALKQSSNVKEFENLLTRNGITLVKHKNKTNKLFGFSFKTDKILNPLPGSKIKRAFSYKNIIQQINKNQSVEHFSTPISDNRYSHSTESNQAKSTPNSHSKEELQKALTKDYAQIIGNTLMQSINLDHFEKLLSKSDIKLIKHRNSSNKIFGISFILPNTNKTIAGSKLKRAFSYKNITNQIKTNHGRHQSTSSGRNFEIAGTNKKETRRTTEREGSIIPEAIERLQRGSEPNELHVGAFESRDQGDSSTPGNNHGTFDDGKNNATTLEQDQERNYNDQKDFIVENDSYNDVNRSNQRIFNIPIGSLFDILNRGQYENIEDDEEDDNVKQPKRKKRL